MSIASEKKESGTWMGSSFLNISGGVLDYIFVTDSCINVEKCEAVDNKINRNIHQIMYPSELTQL